MVTAGTSVLLAARVVAGKAKKLASHILEAAEHDLELRDGEVRVVGAPQLSVKLAELSRILKGAPGYGFPDGLEPASRPMSTGAPTRSPTPTLVMSPKSRSISRPAAYIS